MTSMKNLPPHILNLQERVREAEEECERRRQDCDQAMHKLWSWRHAECEKTGHAWRPDTKWTPISCCDHCGEQGVHPYYEAKRPKRR